MELPIQKGLPTPNKRLNRYPFAKMEVGDSFFAPLTPSASILTSARRHLPKRFTTRSVVENGVRGVRVWRYE